MRQLMLWRLTLSLLLGGLASMPCWALTGQQLLTVQAAARQARDSCLKEMHHDTDEFLACVAEMLSKHQRSSEKQLGLAYLGLVGCMSAARISILHSDVCSRNYLVQADRLIKQLQAKDAELCSAVPGDCSMRLAQIKAMRTSAKAVKQQAN
jgi:hypothetical protein